MKQKILIMVLLILFSSSVYAGDDRSGKISLEGIFAGTLTMLDAGKGNLAITYDGVMGIKALDGTTFGDRATWHCVGGLTALGGKFDNEHGICKWQFPDGDTAFSTYEGVGALGKQVNGKWRFIGGTGKYENISGEGVFFRQSVRGAKDGTAQAYNKSTGTYSLN